MDCDASLDPRELPVVAEPVACGRADLVLGRRAATRGAWPLHARLANPAVAWLLSRRTGVKLHDLGPMRAARRADLVALGIADRRSGWPLEMVVGAGAAGGGWKRSRSATDRGWGQSKVTGTVRGTLQAVADMGRALA